MWITTLNGSDPYRSHPADDRCWWTGCIGAAVTRVYARDGDWSQACGDHIAELRRNVRRL